MTETLTLSVITANYNHAHYIGDALGTILGQSVRPLEVIVIDDGSTDNSVEVIEAFARRDPIVRLLRNECNRGPIFSANRGLEHATGDNVYFAAADDIVLPGFFEKSMNLLAHYPQAGLCSTLSGVMNEKGEYKGLVHTPIISRTASFLSPQKALVMLRRHGSWFMGNTTIYRRAALIEAGGLIPELGAYCDGFIDLVLALKYGACFIPEPLAMWRKMKGTYSKKMSANLDIMLEIMRTAKRLMRSTYSDLFPPEYVDDWQRGELFRVGIDFISASQGPRIAGLRCLLQSPSPVDRAFFVGLRLSMALERLVTNLYLFARLRRAHLWQELARKLKHVVDPRIRRLDGGKRASVQIAITKEQTYDGC